MNRKGFTLTEILMVVVIIAILIAVALPNAFKAVQKADDTAIASNIKSIKGAVVSCFQDKRKWTDCDSAEELKAGKYLDSFPTKADGSDYGLSIDTDTGEITITADVAAAE